MYFAAPTSGDVITHPNFNTHIHQERHCSYYYSYSSNARVYCTFCSRRGAPTSGDVDILITHPNFDESAKSVSKVSFN